MKLTCAEQREVADALVGTCASGQGLASEYDVPIEEIEAAANAHEVALCQTCGWWCETSELNEDDECEDCRGE